MYAITINGTDDADGTLLASETPNVHVSFPGEEPTDAQCTQCGETEGDTDDAECPAGNAEGEDAPHSFEPEPHAWINSANVIVEENEVTVTLSVGDPRGAFAMTVRRMDDGTLRLSVPAPSDGWLHRPLTPLASDGYYQIG